MYRWTKALLLVILMPIFLWQQDERATVARAEDEHAAVVRLMLVDAKTNMLHVIDAASGSVIASFSAPGPSNLYTGSSERYFFAVHNSVNRVTIVDSGLMLVDHGDHKDLVQRAPYVRATINPGRTPIHFFAHDNRIAIHNDGDGTVVMWDETKLDLDLGYQEIRLSQPDHTSIITLDDVVLAGYVRLNVVEAFSTTTGRMIRRLGDCVAAHGEALYKNTAAIGCADGVFMAEKNGSELTTRKVMNPAGTPETVRVGTLAANRKTPLMYGNFGKGLAIIRPGTTTLDVAPLSDTPLKFLFTEDGDEVITLTADGMLHKLEAATGRVLGSVAAVTPFEGGGGEGSGPPRPSLAVAEHMAYATDPVTGTVVEVHLNNMSVTRRINVGGAPTNVVALVAEGADH